MKTEQELKEKLLELSEKCQTLKENCKATPECISQLACMTGQIEAIMWALGEYKRI